jgi:hypothetical protein
MHAWVALLVPREEGRIPFLLRSSLCRVVFFLLARLPLLAMDTGGPVAATLGAVSLYNGMKQQNPKQGLPCSRGRTGCVAQHIVLR